MVPLLNVFISLLVATAIVTKASVAEGAAPLDADGWYLAELEADDVGDEMLNASACNGQLSECNEDEEMAMESESSRRILANSRRRHISYDALKKNRVPCGQRGASYYDCYGHVQVNPYRRGCTMITQCARILH